MSANDVPALDPFRGYANAIRDELPEAITVLDAFHVVKMGSAMVEEARRGIQQESLVPASGSTQSGIGLDLTDGRTRLSLHLGLTMLDLIPRVLRTETPSDLLPTGAIHPRRLPGSS